MKHHFLWKLFFVLVLISGFASLNGDVLLNSEESSGLQLLGSPENNRLTALSRSPSRSLLSISPKHGTALVAELDGTVRLVDSNSMRVIWSFASGSPIYTSYQAPLSQDSDKENLSALQSTGFFIDIGDDWELYMHSEHFGKMKLSMTIDDFINSTPYISEEGAITLGSKKTTVFEVEPVTGKLIRTYTLSDSSSMFQSSEEQSVSYNNNIRDNKELVKSSSMSPNAAAPQGPRLQLMRTDYLLKSFVPNSDKVSWNMTVSEIGAALLCQGIENPFGGIPLNVKDMLGSETGSDIALPLSCQSKAFIFRRRSHPLLESSRPGRLLGDQHTDTMLPKPASGLILPSQLEVHKRLDSDHDNMMLPLPTPDLMPPPQPKTNSDQSSDSGTMRPLSLEKINESGLVDMHDMRNSPSDMLGMFFDWSTALTLTFSFVILMGFVVYRHAFVVKGQVLLDDQHSNSDSKTAPSKRKKNRKSGKNSGIIEKNEKHVSSQDEEALAHIEGDNKTWLNLNKLFDGGTDGRRIGKLLLSNTEIAKGSNGTIVLEGVYEGRPVAVKRLVLAHHDAAFKEIQNLIASDRHPNIVRWYGVEYDKDFVYLSLERCICNLDDLIQIHSDSSQNPVAGEEHATGAMIEYEVRLESVKTVMPNVNLWKANGLPSPLLLKLMRDVVSGLVHLHELGIIHRDLKPQNVLLIKERSLCAKLSDMGISKRLIGDMSSLGHHATGCGSSGWQAPEQLLHGRQTRAVDLFSLGCVLFFCITGGRHPFGDRLERDINIVKNQMDLFLVEYLPEALDLISRLLNPDHELRPKALEVLHHPLFWSSEMRLSFFRDTSDRVELEDRESKSNLLKVLESIAPMALGGKWDEKMEPAFITNIGQYRRYKYDSVRDLLRVMRNKLNHYRELPNKIQELVGPVPEGFDGYFASRFPRLLIEVYRVVCTHCREEEWFVKYLKGNAD